LWVAAYNCSLSCGLHARYDPTKSSTFQPNGTVFDIRYASGPVSGWLESDVVNVGGLSTRTTFAMVDNAGGLGPAFLIGQFDGILGLAFERISVDGIPPVFQDFVDAGILDDNVFGFYLQSDGFHSGELEIGGVDPAHYTGSLNWLNLTSETYWETALDSITLGGAPATTVTKAVFDTGTSVSPPPSPPHTHTPPSTPLPLAPPSLPTPTPRQNPLKPYSCWRAPRRRWRPSQSWWAPRRSSLANTRWTAAKLRPCRTWW
jgi:hypothetical protein